MFSFESGFVEKIRVVFSSIESGYYVADCMEKGVRLTDSTFDIFVMGGNARNLDAAGATAGGPLPDLARRSGYRVPIVALAPAYRFSNRPCLG